MMKLHFLLMAALCLMMTACGSTNSSDDEDDEEDPSQEKALILYYSTTGSTKQLAELFYSKLNDADLVPITCIDPYPENYDSLITRWKDEQEKNILPEVKDLGIDLSKYGVVFLGFPVWGGKIATPMTAMLNKIDLRDKHIVIFCTFGSGGRNSCVNELVDLIPGIDLHDSYGCRSSRLEYANEEVDQFLLRNGFVKGDYEAPEDYSDQQPCTPEQIKLFKQATGSYKMLSATPSSCGMRETDKSTDYNFFCETKAQDGTTSNVIVYVTQPKEKGAKPDFTEVER